MTLPDLASYLASLSTEAIHNQLPRKILTEQDVEQWKLSKPYHYLLAYLDELIQAGTEQDKQLEASHQESVVALGKFLDRAEEEANNLATEPTATTNEQKSAFLEFRNRVEQCIGSLHQTMLPTPIAAALPELRFHLSRSFGSKSRHDYGTGHELSFLLCLVILRLTDYLTPSNNHAIVDIVWKKYWHVVQIVKRSFRLDTAGRRGVWKKDESTGHLVYSYGPSESRIHPSRSSSSISSELHLVSHDTSQHLLRALISTGGGGGYSPSSNTPIATTPISTLSPSPSSTSLLQIVPPSSSSPSRSTSTSSLTSMKQKKKDETSDLLRLYTTSILHSLPVLLHLRFGPCLPFESYELPHVPLPSSADDDDDTSYSSTSLGAGERKKIKDEDLERLQDQRERSESTVAPWNVPRRSGNESESPSSLSSLSIKR